ncbi:hypothetical protein NTGM5_170023 [Candidatus Nitrotoga sp. M5]|nr:hypothetical protein NTGM5_170023 [Candidatus Nitrotoga sp. M5]
MFFSFFTFFPVKLSQYTWKKVEEEEGEGALRRSRQQGEYKHSICTKLLYEKRIV